jgi:hypothetical protein
VIRSRDQREQEGLYLYHNAFCSAHLTLFSNKVYIPLRHPAPEQEDDAAREDAEDVIQIEAVRAESVPYEDQLHILFLEVNMLLAAIVPVV